MSAKKSQIIVENEIESIWSLCSFCPECIIDEFLTDSLTEVGATVTISGDLGGEIKAGCTTSFSSSSQFITSLGIRKIEGIKP